ncbi:MULTISPECIES: winged helix-turn-helix domain-containing protein [Halomonadaceae]|uniref:LysR family transcriptional regulator n=1 Tax=Modicisalibacter zincidurans TaxID=1178777 RepID=A0ABP9RL83_9GAMM|nr:MULTISPECIES: LysR family transcriptional regulator [Halomonas]MCD6009688.1 LysR family transcriptional regulator [Halomonas sp. IOP_31]
MTRTRHDRPGLQIRLVADRDVVLGPGKAALLEAIDASGSIAAASRTLGLSYKKAWQLIDTMNRHLPGPVVTTASGGNQRGGAGLTPLGREVVERYRALQRTLDAAHCEEARSLLALVDRRQATPH